MRLIRFRKNGIEKPGLILYNDKKVDVSRFGQDYDELFFETDGLPRLREWIEINGASLPELRLKY